MKPYEIQKLTICEKGNVFTSVPIRMIDYIGFFEIRQLIINPSIGHSVDYLLRLNCYSRHIN